MGYKQGDNVTLYVNKVGPYHNPQETYHYYTLPVCRPEKVSLCPVLLCVKGLLYFTEGTGDHFVMLL